MEKIQVSNDVENMGIILITENLNALNLNA